MWNLFPTLVTLTEIGGYVEGESVLDLTELTSKANENAAYISLPYKLSLHRIMNISRLRLTMKKVEQWQKKKQTQLRLQPKLRTEINNIATQLKKIKIMI